jgi:hypothetical protein
LELKIKPPVVVEGRAILRGQLTDIAVTRATFKGMDADGYFCLEADPLVARSLVDTPATQKLGSIYGKKLLYEVFRASNTFQVVITGQGATRRRVRSIDTEFLLHVHRAIAKEGTPFCGIRSQNKKTIDSLQLKAALAVLEVTRFVECTREGKHVFYRRVREWSQLNLLA